MRTSERLAHSFTPGVWLTIMLIMAVSCSKHHPSNPGNGCITRKVPLVTDTLVSQVTLDSINALFRANNLSAVGLQFNEMEIDTITNAADTEILKIVWGIQFFHSLPTFQDYEEFQFKGGIYQPFQPAINVNNGYTGPAPDPDTVAHETLPALQEAFLRALSSPVLFGTPYYPAGHSSINYADTCLQATLGYMDAADIPGSRTPLEKGLVKVWKVTPLSRAYPVVYVEDDNGVSWVVHSDVEIP